MLIITTLRISNYHCSHLSEIHPNIAHVLCIHQAHMDQFTQFIDQLMHTHVQSQNFAPQLNLVAIVA
jgi:hypothetical protein